MAKNPALKLGRGRPDRETVITRATLDTWLDLEKLVGEDVIEAYTVLRDAMMDDKTSVTARERCANKVLELHAKFYKTRMSNLKESLEDGDDSEDEQDSVVKFVWKEA